MAVQVVCYQLYIDSHKNNIADKSTYWDVPLAESNHVERLIEHFIQVAAELEVFNKGNPRQIGARIKRMFTRIGLDEMEVNFFRGFLGAVEKKLKNK
jgi:tRNA C32,U32 (ribose-2'-O)-methylase TrmJ